MAVFNVTSVSSSTPKTTGAIGLPHLAKIYCPSDRVKYASIESFFFKIFTKNTLLKFTQTYPPATSVVASQGVSTRYSLACDREVFAELIPFVKGKAQ